MATQNPSPHLEPEIARATPNAYFFQPWQQRGKYRQHQKNSEYPTKKHATPIETMPLQKKQTHRSIATTASPFEVGFINDDFDHATQIFQANPLPIQAPIL